MAILTAMLFPVFIQARGAAGPARAASLRTAARAGWGSRAPSARLRRTRAALT